MAGVDINRTTTGVVLPVAVSGEIWASTQERSIVTQLARQIPLPGGGVSVNILTGDPVAEFVGETEEKPVSRGSLSSKTMKPYKIAVIEPFSNEFRRDLPTLYRALAARLPGAIAKAYDNAVLHGTGAPTGDFDTLAASPTHAVGAGTAYADLLAALTTVATVDDADANAIAASAQLELLLLGELDGNDRPLFAPAPNAPTGQIGSVLGRPLVKNKRVFNAATTPDTIGILGDWSFAAWGQVEGITIRVSDQATLTDGADQLNLWQRNMFAVLCEVEMGFRVRTDDAFVRLTV